jgi:hypothetical protein
VDVIATSTDGLSWAGWRRHEIQPLPRDLSVALIARRLEAAAPDVAWLENADELADRLDDWPLTIELACAYLIASGRGLDFGPEYVELVMSKVLGDELLVPGEYRSHATLFRAVLVALEGLEVRARRGRGGAVYRYALARRVMETLAYLPGRSAHAELAVDAAMRLAGGDAKASPRALVDDVALAFAEFSLVSRTVNGGTAELSTFRVNEAVSYVVRSQHSAQQRVDVLDTVVDAADERLRSALDARSNRAAEHLVPSATSAVQWMLISGVPTRSAILLVGNLGVLWGARHRPDISLEYYDLELGLLDAARIEAPKLRAKIYGAVATLRAKIDGPVNEILDSVALAERMLRSWPIDDDPDDRRTLVYMVLDVCDLLKRQPAEFAASMSRLEQLHADLEEHAAEQESSVFEWLRRARHLLDSPDGDAEALVLIDAIIEDTAAPTELVRNALGMRVEALTNLERIHEAVETTNLACRTAVEEGFGIEDVAHGLINAWLAALQRSFIGVGGDVSPLIESLLAAFEDHELSHRSDQARLDACRFASAAFDGDLEGDLRDTLDRLDANPLRSSLAVRSEEATQALLDSARRVFLLRRRHGGVVLRAATAWRLGALVPGLRCLQLLVDSATVARLSNLPATVQGWWEIDEDSVLLRIERAPVLVAFPRRQSGWLTLEGLPEATEPFPATQQLEEVLLSPQFADAVRTTVVMGPDETERPVIVRVGDRVVTR